ncbi:MAG: 50S ribosomal protein L4 [Leptolyngbya sp. SIO4C5]|nr:50S ribosomal protein L4 [Leptolyngbya sp. SIO4C5]
MARWNVDPDSKILLIASDLPENLYLSVRNVANLKLISATNLNVYDLLLADSLIVTASALEKIQEVYND